MQSVPEATPVDTDLTEPAAPEQPSQSPAPGIETGGPPGLEPTRFGDWERKGRCIDF